jgi:hypothetical protein
MAREISKETLRRLRLIIEHLYRLDFKVERLERRTKELRRLVRDRLKEEAEARELVEYEDGKWKLD